MARLAFSMISGKPPAPLLTAGFCSSPVFRRRTDRACQRLRESKPGPIDSAPSLASQSRPTRASKQSGDSIPRCPLRKNFLRTSIVWRVRLSRSVHLQITVNHCAANFRRQTGIRMRGSRSWTIKRLWFQTVAEAP